KQLRKREQSPSRTLAATETVEISGAPQAAAFAALLDGAGQERNRMLQHSASSGTCRISTGCMGSLDFGQIGEQTIALVHQVADAQQRPYAGGQLEPIHRFGEEVVATGGDRFFDVAHF